MTGQDVRELAAIIRRLSKPLDPQPTGVEPRLPKLDGIKVVVFDVYGTLLVSGSGDISLTSGVSKGSAATEALEASQLYLKLSGDEVVERLRELIVKRHELSDAKYPEVEIREVWAALLAEHEATCDDATTKPKARDRVAVEYECRVNPVWPMPNAVDTLVRLEESGVPLGIVSNAQFFTPIAMEELLGGSLPDLGFSSTLCVWSYEMRQAKPATSPYKRLLPELRSRSVAPDQVLYVGNDMRNDVWPASRVGFRTALFAGDARSLRLREDDQQVAGVEPDAVLTDLRQILTVLPLADG